MKKSDMNKRDIIERISIAPVTAACNFIWSKFVKRNRITLKIISFILIFALVITNINISASAMERDYDTFDSLELKTIISIEKLDNEILKQELTYESEIENIVFPEQLQVILAQGTENHQETKNESTDVEIEEKNRLTENNISDNRTEESDISDNAVTESDITGGEAGESGVSDGAADESYVPDDAADDVSDEEIAESSKVPEADGNSEDNSDDIVNDNTDGNDENNIEDNTDDIVNDNTDDNDENNIEDNADDNIDDYSQDYPEDNTDTLVIGNPEDNPEDDLDDNIAVNIQDNSEDNSEDYPEDNTDTLVIDNLDDILNQDITKDETDIITNSITSDTTDDTAVQFPTQNQSSEQSDDLAEVMDLTDEANREDIVEPVNEFVSVPVVWELNSEKSTKDDFSARKIDDRFVYYPVLPENYILAEGVELPYIIVDIVDLEVFEQSTTIDNIIITVKADKGVFPEGAKLRAERIYNPLLLEEYGEAADQADIDTGNDKSVDKINEKLYAFDICIIDEEGNEIQPDNSKGTVTVEFNNPEPSRFSISDYNVYHIDEESGEAQRLDKNIDSVSESVSVEVEGFSPFVYRAVSYMVILYTGGGLIDDTRFTEVAEYTYASEDEISVESLPIPDFDSEDVEFVSWEQGDDGAFYAGWNRITDSVSEEYVKYNYLDNSINIKGVLDGKEIATSYNDLGARQYIKGGAFVETPEETEDTEDTEGSETHNSPEDMNNTAEGSENQDEPIIPLRINKSGDIFTQIDEDLYIASVANAEGHFVVISYYIWNRSDRDFEGLSLGMAEDIQIGNNDKASLTVSSDRYGKYAITEDAGKAVKLYYTGDVVTEVSTFWTGLATQEDDYIFEDNQTNQTNIDSAIALSWQDIDIPAKQLVKKSYIIGCGNKEDLLPKLTIRIDTDCDGEFGGSDTQTDVKIGGKFVLPAAKQYEGYAFNYYLCEGVEYRENATIFPKVNMDFYGIHSKVESTAKIILLNDDEAWTGQQVDLYQNGEKKYSLTEQEDNTYISNQVVNGLYDIYVNDRKSDKEINVLAAFEPISVAKTVEYNTITVNITLDGTPSCETGTVSLRNGEAGDKYVITGTDGTYIEHIQASEGSYDIFVNKENTDFEISVAEPDVTIDFITARFDITDDMLWTDAAVELRNKTIDKSDYLDYKEGNGTTATYTKYMLTDDAVLDVYINGIDVHRTMTMQPDANCQSADYYTAKIVISGTPSDSYVKMSNGSENYNLELTSLNGTDKIYEKKHVFINDTQGSELSYKVEVTKTQDNAELLVNSTDKELDLDYYTVKYYNVKGEQSVATGNTTYVSELAKTIYILDGDMIPPYFGNATLSAYTFSHWSETKWPGSNTDGSYDFKTMGEKFDFTQPIDRNINLYAVFSSPTITVGKLVYTDSAGNPGGNGNYYRMGNLTLFGFNPGDSSIKYIFLQTSNIESISILDNSAVTITNGGSTVSASGSSSSFTPTSDRVAITFNQSGGVSMAQAQDFIRNQIVIKPQLNKQHGLIIEVTDRGARYIAANIVTASQNTISATKISGTTSVSMTTNNGIYYVSSNVTLNSAKNNNNGIKVGSGCTVYLYIPSGYTLTVYGKDGSGATPGYAGVYLPSGSNLYVFGGGTLVAKGGKAGSGTKGGNGDAASNSGNNVTQGKGGNGGAGGGGGGAGIGTDGGSGGSGGNGGASQTEHFDTYIAGKDGSAGGTGSKPSEGGYVYYVNATINATGGAAGSGGGGGSAGASSTPTLGNYLRNATGGAGGGGGGGGYAGNAIGAGGAGGGGGGGGASAGAVRGVYHVGGGGGGGGGGANVGSGGNRGICEEISSLGDYGARERESAGGNNGSGGSGGNGGVGATIHTWPREGSGGSTKSGGTGGKGGNAGAAGASRSKSSYTGKTYKIKFDVSSNSKAGSVTDITYITGKSVTITMPAYIANDEDVRFLGWQIKVYAKSAKTGDNLTTNSTERYNAGDTITLGDTTFGDITFAAVTEVVGGIRDDDSYTINIAGTETEIYYTYNVIIKEDGTAVDKGRIQIGNQTVSPSVNNVYTITTTDNTTYGIKINDEIVGYTGTVTGQVSSTEINYSSIKVKIEGLEPYNVQLVGEGAPVLVDQGNRLYSYTDLASKVSSNTIYDIYVNGQNSTHKVSFGQTETVRFCTLTVNVTPNGMNKSDIEKVELRNAAGNMTAMTRTSAYDTQFTFTKVKSVAAADEYTIYVNGVDTGIKCDCLTDNTKNITFTRYKTTINIKVDGVPADQGTVRLGTDNMTRVRKGVYQLTVTDNASRALYVDGSMVRAGVTPGSNLDINYYTITYNMSGERPDKETGETPQDTTQYLTGTAITLMSKQDLINGDMTFEGWRINGYTYKPGQTYTISGVTQAYAVWQRTDISGSSVELNATSFTYNSESRKPNVIIEVNGKKLKENNDYIIKYSNTNKAAGRYDSAGSEKNTINAGTVTVTVEGAGDYRGTAVNSYVILPKTIKVQNLKAIDKIYDGTCAIELDTERAFLEGVAEGDDVSLGTSLEAYVYSEFAKEDKLVKIEGNGLLTGQTLSNYVLEAMEPVYVDILPKTITKSMFSVNNVTYNGQEQEPNMSAYDAAGISSNDYAVTYTNNIHAGKGIVKISTTNPKTNKSYGNYTGEIEIEFTIDKAQLQITALAASSVYGEEIVDVTNYYNITAGSIKNTADAETLNIKAYTTVKRDYDIGVYTDSIRIDYNRTNTDYNITQLPASYTITKSANLPVIATGYAGIYDGSLHGIKVVPKLYAHDDTMKIYYSLVEINSSNLPSLINAGKATTNANIVKDAGDYVIYYAVVTNNYTTVFGSQTVKIGKKKLDIKANPHTVIYGNGISEAQPNGSLVSIVVSGLEGEDTEAVLGGSLSFISNDYQTGKPVGEYSIKPTGLTSNNYDIRFISERLTVAPRNISFSWSADRSFTYTGNEQGVKVKATNLYGTDTISVRTENATKVSAGSYTARVTGIYGELAVNYKYMETDDNLSAAYSINKATNDFIITPSIQGWEIPTGVSAQSISGNEPVAAAKFGIVRFTYAEKPEEESQLPDDSEYSTTKPTEPGIYYMKASVADCTDYTGLTGELVVFEIVQLESAPEIINIYVVPKDKKITYGEDIGNVEVVYKNESGTVFTDTEEAGIGVFNYRTDYQKADSVRGSVGSYVIEACNMTAKEGYNLIYQTATLTVEPKSVALIWNNNGTNTYTYTGNPITVDAKVKSDSIVNENDDIYVAAYTDNEKTSVGDYTAKANSLAGNGANNYTLPVNSYEWSITKAANTWTKSLSIENWYYGDKPSEPKATAEHGNVKYKYKKCENDDENWILFDIKTASTPVEVGKYQLIAYTENSNQYTELSEEDANAIEFYIQPAQVSVVANSKTSAYGEVSVADLTYSLIEMKGKLTQAEKQALGVSLSTTANQNSPVGNYKIEAATNEQSYVTVEKISGIYTVTPADIVVTASDKEINYDGQKHSIQAVNAQLMSEASYSAKIYYSETPLNSRNYGIASVQIPEYTDAGIHVVYYYITAPNYNGKSGSVKLTINKKDVDVKINDAEIIYGQAPKNNGLTYDGFLCDDEKDSLNLNPVFTYKQSAADYAAGSPVGIYDIGIVLADTTNYHFVVSNGRLTVAKKELDSAMFEPAVTSYDYDRTEKKPNVNLSGTDIYLNTSDYEITYEDNINAGNEAKIVITAKAAGNYKGTTTKQFTIKPRVIEVRANSAGSVYNRPIAELSYIVTSVNDVIEPDVLDMKAVTSVKKGYAAGTYTDAVTVEYDTSNTNYEVRVTKANYVVANGSLEVTTVNYNGIYDGKEHNAEVIVKTGKYMSAPVIYYSASATVDDSNYESALTTVPKFKNAGTYTVYYYVKCDSFDPVSGSVTVNIGKAPLEIIGPTAEITYGDEATAVINNLITEQRNTNQFTFKGLMSSDSAEQAYDLANSNITFSTDYNRYSDAGEYEITYSGISESNYTLTGKPGKLVVKKKNITFEWPTTSLVYNGKSQDITATIVGKISGDDVQIEAYVNEGTNTNQAVNVGDYIATVNTLKGAKANNYCFDKTDIATACEWTITRATNEFTVLPFISEWKTNSIPSNPIGAAKFGTISYSYSNSEDGVYSSTVPTAAGTYYLKATVIECDNYTGLEVKTTFNIIEDARPVEIVRVVAPDATITYGDNLNIPSEEISYVLPNGKSLPEVIEGSAVVVSDYHMHDDAGQYITYVSGISAKEGYEIQLEKGTLTVNKKPISLSWTTDNYYFDGEEKVVEAKVSESDLISGDSLYVTEYEYNKATDAGQYSARAISFGGTNRINYLINETDRTHTWHINKADGTIAGSGNSFTEAPAIENWTYGMEASKPSGAAKFGELRFLYSDAVEGTYTQTVPTAAGIYFMKAQVPGNSNYDMIESNPVQFTICKANITVVADDMHASHGSTLDICTYSVSGALLEQDRQSLGILLTTTARTDSKIGEYPISITVVPNDTNKNYNITTKTGYYFITAGNTQLNVEAAGYQGTYDGCFHDITVLVTDRSHKTPTDIEIYYSTTELNSANYGIGSKTSPKFKNAGKYKVYYYIASDVYEAVAGSKNIEISQKTVGVSANSATIIYGEAPQNNGVIYGDFIGEDSPESLHLNPDFNINYERYAAAGQYRIVPCGLPDNGNYKYNYQAGILTVEKRKVTFAWTGTYFSYDGNEKKTYADVIGRVNNDIIDVLYEEDREQSSLQRAINVGSYRAKVIGLKGDRADSYYFEPEGNYVHDWTISSSTNSFITELTIDNWTYGTVSSEPYAKTAYGAVKYTYSTTREGVYTITKPVNAGSYFVKATVEGTKDFTGIVSAPVMFTIKKAPVNIIADDIVVKCGNEIGSLTYSVEGYVNEADEINVSVTTTATSVSEPGSYPIIISVARNDNYEINAVNGICHITDEDLNVNIEGYYAAYDGKEHGIRVEVNNTQDTSNDEDTQPEAGLAEDNIAVYYSTEDYNTAAEIKESASLQSPLRTLAGTTKVYYFIMLNDDLKFKGTRNITVTKKDLTVKANDNVIVYGMLPAHKGVTFEGFVNGEDERVLGGSLSYLYDYQAGNQAGEYSIKPGGLTSNNYNIIFTSGKLTVNPEQKTLTIRGITKKDGIYNGEQQPGYDGEPSVESNFVTEFVFEYFDSEDNLLSEVPVDAGDYKVRISISEDNMEFKGSVELEYTVEKCEVTVKPHTQAILANTFDENSFIPLEPVYVGFVGEDNKDNQAIETKATVTVNNTVNFDNAGTYSNGLLITQANKGVLTEEANKNYNLKAANGALTVVPKVHSGSETESLADQGGSCVTLGDPTGGSGTVHTAVILDEAGLPNMALEANLTAQRAEGLLGADDAQAVRDGEDAIIYLVVSDISTSIESTDEDMLTQYIQQQNKEISTGLYLDLTMFKQVGTAAPEKISDIENTGNIKARIRLQIPETMRNRNEDIERYYMIVYVHNGVVKSITPTREGDELVFESSEFSIYSICYYDTQKQAADTNPQHQDTTPIIIINPDLANNTDETENNEEQDNDEKAGDETDNDEQADDETDSDEQADDETDSDEQADDETDSDEQTDDVTDSNEQADNETDSDGQADDETDSDGKTAGETNGDEQADDEAGNTEDSEGDSTEGQGDVNENNTADSDAEDTDDVQDNNAGNTVSDSNTGDLISDANDEESAVNSDYLYILNLVISILALIAVVLMKKKKSVYHLSVLITAVLVEIIVALISTGTLTWIIIIPYAVMAVLTYMWQKKHRKKEDAQLPEN